MSWSKKYVVLRPDATTLQLLEVFASDELSKANYWLRYIALVDDALFLTPLHPKQLGAAAPVYSSHKVGAGKTAQNQKEWTDKFGSFPMVAVPETPAS